MSFLFSRRHALTTTTKLVSLVFLAALMLTGCVQQQGTGVTKTGTKTAGESSAAASTSRRNGPPVVEKLAGEAVVLVKDGVSMAPIILIKDAPPKLVQATDELALYIEKTTGAKPEILTGAPSPIPASAIWVGYQPALDALFPGVDLTFNFPEEILLAANSHHVVIAGRDLWHPGHTTIKTKRGTIDGVQMEYGTINAVFTFIQEKLNVRWLWPGETGEDIVPQKTLALTPFSYRYHPQMVSRGGLLTYSSLIPGGYATSQDWTRQQRISLDSMPAGGGHAFSTWWDKYHETNPDYFAMQPDGTRSGYPDARTVKLCESNPAVWDQWIKNVEESLQDNPNQNVFNGSPNDGYSAGICVCENCRAWDNTDADKFNYIWSGTGQAYVAMSDRYTIFANKLAAKLKERYPDKDYYVLMMAYGFARPAPIKAVPAENVIISYVGHIPWAKPLTEHEKAEFSGWANKGSHPMFYRPNTGSQFGWQQGLPEVMLKDTIDVFAYLRDHNTTGIFIDTVWEHWGTQAPQYYLMTQLTWNLYADPEAILNDFYTRAFGPAAKAMRQYWQVMEDARQARFDNPPKAMGMERLAEGYDTNVRKDAQEQIDNAMAAVVKADPKYKARVEWVAAGFRRSTLFLDTIPMMTQYIQGGQKDEKLAQEVRDKFNLMDELVKQYPYIVNARPLRPGTPRMTGTHPDVLPKMAGAGGASPIVNVTPYTDKNPPTLKEAKDQGWTLVFSDNFDRKDLATGELWTPVSGNWAIQDNQLVGSDGYILTSAPIVLNAKASFQRIEFDATSLVNASSALTTGNETASSNVRVCDISPMLQIHTSDDPKVPSLKTGYFMQFGGYWNKRNQIRQSGVSIFVDNEPTIVIKPGVKQHIVAENDYGHLKLFVDGQLVYHQSLKATIVGGGFDRAGIYLTTPSKIDNVKIYAKPYESGLDTE